MSTPKFYLKIEPAKTFKLAITSLCEPKFNPLGIGKFTINESCLEILAYNNKDGLMGNILLPGSLMPKFVSNTMISKLIDLRNLNGNLVIDEDDFVIISHREGRNLNFVIGKEPRRGFEVAFLDNMMEIPECPPMKCYCDAAIGTAELIEVIGNLVENEEPPLVYVDITKDLTIIRVGTEKIEYDYGKLGVTGTMGAEWKGQRHQASFYWPYIELLKTATQLYPPGFIISFASDEPPGHVIMRFRLPELGQLIFIQKAVDMFTDERPNKGIIIENYFRGAEEFQSNEFVDASDYEWVENPDLIRMQSLIRDGVYVDAISLYISKRKLNFMQYFWLKYCPHSTPRMRFLAELAWSIMGETPPPKKTDELFNYTGGGDVDLANFGQVLDFFMMIDLKETAKKGLKKGATELATFGMNKSAPRLANLYESLKKLH